MEHQNISEIIEKIGISERTVKRIIKQLRDANKLSRSGSDKKGEWIILNNK